MGPLFPALLEARVASARLRREFDLCLALVGFGVVVLLGLRNLPAATKLDMLLAGQDFALFFFNRGGLYVVGWLMLAFLLFLVRERHVVHALRTFHSSNPKADRAASERWLRGRLALLSGVTALLSLPGLVAWGFAMTLPSMVGLFWVIAPMTIIAAVFLVWGWEYRPIDMAAQEALRRAVREAWDAGVGYSRTSGDSAMDLAKRYEDAEWFPQGEVRDAFLEGVKDGARLRKRSTACL